MFTVGAIIDRPQTTANQKTSDQWSPLQTNFGISFSLPIFVIMWLHRRAGLASAVTKGLSQSGGGSKPPPYKGETGDTT